jgi:NAD(P)-dependent dehydrogenase (short-subunit alcohol dehydrogenase family)
MVYGGDVRDAASLARAASDFIARCGVPDLVIANAGISRGVLTEAADDLPVFRAVL